MKENFNITYVDDVDENTIVVTSSDKIKGWIEKSLASYDPENKQYSTYLNDKTSSSLSLSDLDSYAENPQNNLDKIIKINEYARTMVNEDDLLGKVYESIESNVNTNFSLIYNDFTDRKTKVKTLDKVQRLISDFNKQINLKSIIRRSIPTCYLEGTFIMCLRNKNENWIVDYYPLGVAIISDYESNGQPVVLIDINELESRLRKTMIKTKKGKSLFFDNTENEIKANYPPEVYQAYKNKEKYAILSTEYSGVIRINNMNRKYGLTPIFRALRPTLMLRTFSESDEKNTKAKAKKIIHQIMRKETIRQNLVDDTVFELMSYAHNSFMSAFKQNTVAYTSVPGVEKIEYVEPSVETTDSKLIAAYRERVLTSLGIGFLAEETQTSSTAKISLNQLMLTINKIGEQLESVIENWYRTLLSANGIKSEFIPTIKIMDSEALSQELRMSLSGFMYNTLGFSRKTVFDTLGYSLEHEMQQRIHEKDDNLDEIFYPYSTAYNTSGEGDDSGGASSPSGNKKINNVRTDIVDKNGNIIKVGRPQSNEDEDKRDYDKDRYEDNKGI